MDDAIAEEEMLLRDCMPISENPEGAHQAGLDHVASGCMEHTIAFLEGGSHG